MGVRNARAVLFCDGDGCGASVDVAAEDGQLVEIPLPAGWTFVNAHTSRKVVPKAARDLAEQYMGSISAVSPNITGQMRDMYDDMLSRQQAPFTWRAHLCAACQERPLSVHLTLAIARAEADSARPIGVPLPFAGFGVVAGGAPAVGYAEGSVCCAHCGVAFHDHEGLDHPFCERAATLADFADDEAANTPPSRRFTLAPDQEDI